MSETPRSSADVAAVQARHEPELLRRPNVVGVATGAPTAGRPLGLMVFVSRKVPASELGPAELLPREIDGVPVHVVETGAIKPL